MSTHVAIPHQDSSVNVHLSQQLGTFLEYVPVADWNRVTRIYDHSRPLAADETGLNKVAGELGILWKGLKHTLPEEQLDKCFRKLIIIAVEGDMRSLLRKAHEDINANILKADKSREQLVQAALTSSLDESYYLDQWVDGRTLSAEIIEYWERFYGVDIFSAVQNGHGSDYSGKGADPIKPARQVMALNLVKAVPIMDYDDLLARVLGKLMGGSPDINRGMIRRYRRIREESMRPSTVPSAESEAQADS